MKQLPNFITTLNLLSGVIAVFFALNGKIEVAAYLIFVGAIFDFLDGYVARALKAYSDMGKELDSLADLITFGMAPAAIVSNLMYGLKYASTQVVFFEMVWYNQVIVLSPFVLVAFAALRLAKFNVDTRQSEVFLGLTTTATGMFVASFTLLLAGNSSWAIGLLSPISIILGVGIFSMLLVSEIPMFSLKFKSYGWLGNEERYILLAAGIAFISIWNLGGVSILIVLYILFSMVMALIHKILS